MAAIFQDGRQTDVPKIVFALDMHNFIHFDDLGINFYVFCDAEFIFCSLNNLK